MEPLAGPGRNARPPISVGPAGPVPRPTVKERTLVVPRLLPVAGGYPAQHQYIRRYWTAALGAPAVGDLLRLIQAAKRGTAIRRPLHIRDLAMFGLVGEVGSRLWVRSTVPDLPPLLLERLPPRIRQELSRA